MATSQLSEIFFIDVNIAGIDLFCSLTEIEKLLDKQILTGQRKKVLFLKNQSFEEM